ncbi:ABC transporter permease subunit [Chitinasiproducens palmae]|uniref:Putative spermidine/putrescine transport system permease protein n=1 Tax=Chitinasiproducens palmae TaxID=1770053 RepID=A0A1H2PW36_9BURK|nr:ABC transporter permease subunit [Chitinasiproducens palmae]SDV50722.1 putative spermidine/putrescine transport system permease protein [Chitinasiproducens palmae]
MTLALRVHPTNASRRRSAWLAASLRVLPAVPTLLFLLVFFIVPVGEILQGGLVTSDGTFGFAQYERIARTPVYAKVLWITFAISFMTAAFSVALGYPVAYLLSRVSERVRERWLLWIMLPFWTSYLVKTYAWMLLLSKTGVLSTMALALGIVHQTNGTIPSLTGVLIGMVHSMLPLAVMTMLPVMRGIDDRLGQAAQTLGAERSTSFFTVFLPLSSPGVAAAGLLVFISSLGFFIVPALLGSPRETMIAQLVISSVLELFDMHFAGALSTVLLICSIAIFFVYDRMVGLASLTGEVSDKRRASRAQGVKLALLMTLGRVCAPLVRRRGGVQAQVEGVRVFSPLGLFTMATLVVLVVPVLSVIPYAFTRSDFITFPPKLFSLRWFGTFASSPVWQGAFVRSFGVGFGTAVLSLVLGFGATLAMTRMPQRATKPLFALLVAPLIVPRIVVAVGLLYLLSRFGLTGTNTGLIIGHTVLAIPYVVVTLAAGFQRFDWRLDDAARVMGASPLQRIRTVVLPLLMASVTAAFLFAFLVSFDDLTIAIFVSGGVNTTLPKQMWDDIQLAITPTLAAVSTLLIVLIAVVIAMSSWLKHRAR